MKITVDRTHTHEGNLVFTITVSDPKIVDFGPVQKIFMQNLDRCRDQIDGIIDNNNKVHLSVLATIHHAKERVFTKFLDCLKFNIKNEFRPTFDPICQEIYNWIYDKQSGDLKTWMCDFDPQRTKYYFNNDKTAESNYTRQQSEHDDEDEIDDED